MRWIVYIVLFAWLLFTGSCSQNDVYLQRSKTLDSLSGAVNSMINELAKADTAVLELSIVRVTYYKQFIEQNIRDTIDKINADNLQHFYISGHNLQSFAVNRTAIRVRALKVNSQLEKLGTDVRNKSLTVEELNNYCAAEKQNAAGLLDLGHSQMKLFHQSLEEFRNSLNGVETLIRSHNNGELPVIVKDTTSL
jgi:hypothetical protein